MRAFVFDAYGTLFDVHSLDVHAVAPRSEALSQLWRQKQVEYTWRRALMQRYQDFWHVTARNRGSFARGRANSDRIG